MKTKNIHILTGILFMLAGIISLLEGVYHTRGSNIFIGIGFAAVGYLYLRNKFEEEK